MIGRHTAIIFWEDETYDHNIIGEGNEFIDERRMVLLAVYHIQKQDPLNPGQPDPNAIPNLVRFSTHANNAGSLLSSPKILVVRDVEESPPFVRQFEFDLEGNLDQRNLIADMPPDIAITGMDRTTNNVPFHEPGFFDLRDRAIALTETLHETDAPQSNIPW